MKTLKEAKKHVRKNSKAGVFCPCCNKFVKIWKKTMISSAVASLIILVRLYKAENEYYHITKFSCSKITVGSGNFAQLVLWGMVKRKPNNDETKKFSGYYKPTKKGIKFVEGKLKTKKYLHSYNNLVIKTSGKKVNVHDVLKGKFDYSKLRKLNK